MFVRVALEASPHQALDYRHASIASRMRHFFVVRIRASTFRTRDDFVQSAAESGPREYVARLRYLLRWFIRLQLLLAADYAYFSVKQDRLRDTNTYVQVLDATSCHQYQPLLAFSASGLFSDSLSPTLNASVCRFAPRLLSEVEGCRRQR